MISYRERSIPQTFKGIVDPRQTALVAHSSSTTSAPRTAPSTGRYTHGCPADLRQCFHADLLHEVGRIVLHISLPAEDAVPRLGGEGEAMLAR